MNDIFKLRSFVENQVERLSTPKNLIVDKFRQTVDNIKMPFSGMVNNEKECPQASSSTHTTNGGPPLSKQPLSASSSSSSESAATSSSPFSIGNQLFVSLTPV